MLPAVRLDMIEDQAGFRVRHARLLGNMLQDDVSKFLRILHYYMKKEVIRAGDVEYAEHAGNMSGGFMKGFDLLAVVRRESHGDQCLK